MCTRIQFQFKPSNMKSRAVTTKNQLTVMHCRRRAVSERIFIEAINKLEPKVPKVRVLFFPPCYSHERPLPGVSLVEVVVPLVPPPRRDPLVLGRPRQPHQVPQVLALVLVVVQVLHVVHELDLQPENGGKTVHLPNFFLKKCMSSHTTHFDSVCGCPLPLGTGLESS